MATEQPHLILLAFPAQGHIIPSIQFAETLASAGFVISFVCAEHRIAQIRSRYGSRLSPNVRLLELPDEVPVEEDDIDQGVQNLLSTITLAESMAPAFEQTVKTLIQDSKELGAVSFPLGILSDFYASWSQDTATKFNIPRYVFFPSPCSCLAVMLYLPRLIAQDMIPIAPDVRHVQIPGLPLLTSSEMPRSWHHDSLQVFRDFSIRNLLKLHKSSGILVNTAYELEAEAIDAVRSSEAINPNKVPVYPVGPMLPSKLFKRSEPVFEQESSETDSECLKWLDAQATSSVLYISFGSIAILSIHQLQEIAKALDACEQAFLWVLRLPPSATEATVFPEGFLSRTHSRGFIISTWAPQLLILSHPSTGGFMSHCGWNSTLESICSGVPILPLPQFAEQEMISTMVTEVFKVGVKLDQKGADGVAESGEIEKAIRELLQGDEGKAALRRARALKEEAARAVAEGGSSHTSLLAFVEKATKSAHTHKPDLLV